MEEESTKVARGDHPEGRQEEDSRRPLHREGGGRGQGPGDRVEGRPAAPGEARGHAVGAASVPPQGALPWGHLGAEVTAVACSVPSGGSQSTFHGETEGPLGGGAGALLPSGCGMEEEAGEGEGERKQGCEVQGEAWEEAAKVSAKAGDAKLHGSVSDAATVQTILTSHDAQEEIKSAFLPIHSFAITVGRYCFAHLSSSPKPAVRGWNRHRDRDGWDG